MRLFDPAGGEWIGLHRHLNAVFGIAFSPDGRRLISGGGGREAVKLWDVGTRQELLTLNGAGSFMDVVRWSADGDVILGGAPKEYRHKYVGSVAGLGLYKGVAHVYGIKVKGLPAWFMHRTYHMSRIPSFNRKVRVVADWTLAFVLKRETISLGQLHAPREEFTEVATPTSEIEKREPVGAGAR